MPEIDKVHFGKFLMSQRKEKGYTQKELAQKLFISDKAVSKWERGISLPDIQMLIPLADILGVTVTELLEGKRIESEGEMKAGDVEDLVKKALALSGETPKRDKRKHGVIFGASILVVVLEGLLLFRLGYTMADLEESGLLVGELLGIIFGAYFWFGMKERLPSYYDENKISVYTDGIFEMNFPGIHFNNRNWPYIVRTVRIWSVVSVTVLPLVCIVVRLLLPDVWSKLGLCIVLMLFFGGLFIPIYVAGRDKRRG